MNVVIENIDKRIKDLVDLKKETEALFLIADKERNGFSPEDVGFTLVAADVKAQYILYRHDTFALQIPSRRLYLGFSPLRKEARYVLSSAIPSKKKKLVNGIPNSDHFLYRGEIKSLQQYHDIVEEVVKFTLKEGDLVECTTPEERKRVIDAYLKMDIPEGHHEFFATPTYDVQQYPNLRWSKDKLSAYMDPNKQRNLMESSYVLPIDEFIKRMNNYEHIHHQRVLENAGRNLMSDDKMGKQKKNWFHLKG